MTHHVLDIESLGVASIVDILDRAEGYAHALEQKTDIAPRLKNKVIFNLFFEESTRTRMSFELAVKRLGGDVINFAAGQSSLKKGESYYDTLATLAAMGPDAVILRHSEYNAPRFAASVFKCPIINAGDSWRAHPTQALLDALTIKYAKGTLEGQVIAICGDIAHSRVARSNYVLLTKLGATVRIVAPPMLMPQEKEFGQATRFNTIEDGIAGADIIMMLRLQKERMQAGLIDNEIAYFNTYGLTEARLKLAKPDVFVMHPGPMNRGVEISDEVADDPRRSLILRQVALGVPVRMAVMDYACL